MYICMYVPMYVCRTVDSNFLTKAVILLMTIYIYV